jgi:N-acetylneuraminic acid mutarotase
MPDSLRRYGRVCVSVAVLLSTPVVMAQQTARWTKAAPFPIADEELYGVTSGGKMYVVGGYGGGKGRGLVYEYDPATDKWAVKKPMPRPAHHAALAEFRGKVLIFGGFVAPTNGAGWEPIDNVWEFDPVADSWKALAPLPSKRGSAVAVEVGGKVYVIGGATTVAGSKDVAFNGNTPANVLTTNDVYDPATNTWKSAAPMTLARNHAFAGAVDGKIYVIGGRMAHAFIAPSQPTDVVEEYDPATNTWGGPKARMPTPRSGGGWASGNGRIYVAGGEIATTALVGAFRAVEAYDPKTNTWEILPSMPIPRHGVAGGMLGKDFHLVSGMVTSAAVGAGSDPKVEVHTTSHDVLHLP